MTVILAQQFHPMRGHVEHGAQIRLTSGETITLKSEGCGWRLHGTRGPTTPAPMRSAYEVTAEVLRLDGAT